MSIPTIPPGEVAEMRTQTRLPILFCAAISLLWLAGCSDEPKISTSSPEALKSYTEARSLYEKFYYREAEEACNKAIAADSLFAMAWVQRALISSQSSDEREAKEAIARAMRLSSNASRSEQMIVRMWYHRINYATVEAAAVADSIIERYPTVREAYLLRGQLYELSKNSESAIRMYQRAILLDSSYAPCVMSLGYAYSNLGDFTKASNFMERYIRLLPNDADPRASYADVLLRAGQYDLALEQYRKSLELKPDYWYSIQKIGDVYSVLGRLNAAEEQYHRALELLPKSHGIAVQRLAADGRLSYLRGNFKEALRLFTEANRIDSTSGEPAWGIVYSLTKLKQYDDADQVIAGIHTELARRNLLLSPVMTAFNLVRAISLKERGEYDQALAACDEALQFAVPLNRSGIYNVVADIHLRQKEYEQALDACEEALAVNPNAPETLLTLLKIYHGKKDMRMTREIGGRLMSLWDKADSNFIYLNEAREALGRTTVVSR
jgi:tetratricopeptide (TPR) repeat protein